MEQIRSPLAARRVVAEGQTVVVHAGEDWLQRIRDDRVDFFSKLTRRLTDDGIPLRLAAAGGSTSRVLLGQDHVHIMVGQSPRYGRNILHAHPAYVWGFWYLDEVGIHWNSSIRFARFNAEEVDADKAAYFFNGVSGHMLRNNISREPQVALSDTPLEPAAAVVFCQELEGNPDRCHFLGTEDMIRTAAETFRGQLVYVKLHPSQSKPQRRAIMEVCHDYAHVRLSTASVHDLSAASAVVVTQNSAAGFEALMQKKPVITCARSDFWHATLTPRTGAELRDALLFGQEMMADFDHEKYFYWFLGKKCLEPQKENFTSRAWARIRDKAFL